MPAQNQSSEPCQDTVLINDWHVVARSRDLSEGKILKVRVLGEDLIVWRHGGEVMAWKDLCIHRGSRLSLGWVEDGQIVCPYHGWHYDSSGACTLMPAQPNTTLACSVQACVHLLALGGYGLPVQECCRNGTALEPPLGQWEWRCSLMPEEGFAIGALPGAALQLNPSELALLQRLLRPALPMRRDGELMGPPEVWLRLLAVVECWTRTHLPHHMRALGMLREAIISSGDGRS